ncbi:cbb3-type cytochrome oxidase subunit 3 [Limibacillus halophilus]|jgi:cytochrome c oxidase cbb3-type subunit 4
MDELIAFLRSFWVLWLMLLFIGIIAYAYWPKRKQKMESYGAIPLRDDDKSEANHAYKN